MSATRSDAIAAEAWPLDAVRTVEELTLALHALRERTEQLQHALDSRIVIEQAKGVLAERYGFDTRTAFDVLRRSARSAQMPLRQLAAAVIESPTTPDQVARELARRRKEG